MKNLSSWLIIMFVIMFWGFRAIVAITAANGGTFVTQPMDNNIEIALLFVVLICIPFIFKRKAIGAFIYLIGYGYYFGSYLFTNVMSIAGGATLGTQQYTDMFFALVGVALAIVVLFDLLIDKNRMKNPIDKKTDWFYKNEEFDRNLDDRADKNNYRTM